MSTYLQLCQKMIRDLGMSNTITTVTSQTGMNQKITDWIADADEEIQTMWADWNFLWSQYSTSTIASTREYAKPTALGEWDRSSFYLNYTTDSYTHLTEIPYITWRESYRQGTHTNATPASFIITPLHNIYLDPIPNAIYTLTADYWKVPTRMTTDSSTSAIPTRFERIIIAKAKIHYAEHEEFPNVYELATKEYEELYQKLAAAELPGQMARRRAGTHDIKLTIRPV